MRVFATRGSCVYTAVIHGSRPGWSAIVAEIYSSHGVFLKKSDVVLVSCQSPLVWEEVTASFHNEDSMHDGFLHNLGIWLLLSHQLQVWQGSCPLHGKHIAQRDLHLLW